MLGIGFEDRSDAFDFGVALQEVRRHMDATKKSTKKPKKKELLAAKKDYSLKEGETINITIGVLPLITPDACDGHVLTPVGISEQGPPSSSRVNPRARTAPVTIPPASTQR